MIYLDNAATTQVSPKVLAEMEPYFRNQYGNAGTLYKLGRDAASAVSKARKRVAEFIGARPEQIIFTSGGSEANNLALFGVREHLIKHNTRTIIVSAAEHDSLLKAAESLSKPIYGAEGECIKSAFDIEYLGVQSDGSIDINELKNMITDDVGMVSVMYVNNETGSVNPVREIGCLCKEQGILFHTDCVQAAGCHPIDVEEFNCDLLTISSHKIHGCKGVGAIYVRNPEIMEPIIYGGANQEYGLRGGTANVAGIVGFGKACEITKEGLVDYSKTATYYKQLFYCEFLNTLRGQIDYNSIKVNGQSIDNIGKILNISIEGVDAETLVLLLDAQGICASAGSACRSYEINPSHVLTSMGLSPAQARSSIRFSFSEFNNPEEIVSAARTVANSVIRLK